jgi:hypothetical protein
MAQVPEQTSGCQSSASRRPDRVDCSFDPPNFWKCYIWVEAGRRSTNIGSCTVQNATSSHYRRLGAADLAPPSHDIVFQSLHISHAPYCLPHMVRRCIMIKKDSLRFSVDTSELCGSTCKNSDCLNVDHYVMSCGCSPSYQSYKQLPHQSPRCHFLCCGTCLRRLG